MPKTPHLRELWSRLGREPHATLITAGLCAPWVWAALAGRWRAAAVATFPGHADPAFYFSFARNIATGRGAVIDYIWHFWVRHPDLTHFAADYWLPLPSLIVAAAMKLSGTSVVVAVRTSVVMSLAFAVATGSLGRALGVARWACVGAAALAFVSAPATRFAVEVDSSLFYSAFALASLTLAIRGRGANSGWLAVGSGLASGCAHLCRNDGVLLLACLLAALGFWRPPRLGRRLALTLLGHGLVLAPFALALFRATGRLAPAHGALPFLVDYEDLYALPPGPTFRDSLRAGVWEALLLRQQASLDRASDYVRDLTGVPALLLVFAAGFLAGARESGGARARAFDGWARSRWLLPGMFAVVLFLAHTLVTPVASAAGAYTRSLPAVLAILLVVLSAVVSRMGSASPVAALLAVVLVGWPWHQQSRSVTARVVRENNQVAERLAALDAALNQDSKCMSQPVVVMTRDPWELNTLTGYRAVQIPNASAEDVLAIAARYSVTHLVASPRRRALVLPPVIEAFTPVPGVPGLARLRGLAAGCERP
ncbi:MAG: hypothetical protein HYZ29_04345 [Myxococcales bacterium]|nr:hypothetical protein [Myxococcales bacterium]